MVTTTNALPRFEPACRWYHIWYYSRLREKVILLLPLSYNDGTTVPKNVVEQILHELFIAFGGYTIAGEVEGAYAMQSGAKQIDTCLDVWVAAESDESSVDRLRSMVAGFGALLGQETMYFERTGSKVESIRPEDHSESDGE